MQLNITVPFLINPSAHWVERLRYATVPQMIDESKFKVACPSLEGLGTPQLGHGFASEEIEFLQDLQLIIGIALIPSSLF